MQKKYCLISGVLFSLVAATHLLRIIIGASVLVDTYVVPLFVSWIGFFVPAILAFWAFRLNQVPSAA